MARRVPESIGKWAVRSASPISTTLSKLQRSFQMAGKLRQCEWLDVIAVADGELPRKVPGVMRCAGRG